LVTAGCSGLPGNARHVWQRSARARNAIGLPGSASCESMAAFSAACHTTQTAGTTANGLVVRVGVGLAGSRRQAFQQVAV